MRQIVVSITGLVLAAGCNSVFEPEERSIILPITRINAPSTVAPGVGFWVSFIVESGGCSRFERVESTKTDKTLTVVARGTQVVGENIVCPTDIRFDTHQEFVTPPASDPFSVVARQPGETETSVQIRVQ